MRKHFCLWAILIFAATARLEARDSLKVFRRTGIYAEIGGPGYIHLNGNLEHYFFNGKLIHTGLRVGYGTWGSWGGSGSEAIFTASGQLGRRYHFAEIQTGALFITDNIKNNNPHDHGGPTPIYTYPFASVGYVLRWKFLQFKANVNSKLTINAGVGVTF